MDFLFSGSTIWKILNYIMFSYMVFPRWRPVFSLGCLFCGWTFVCVGFGLFLYNMFRFNQKKKKKVIWSKANEDRSTKSFFVEMHAVWNQNMFRTQQIYLSPGGHARSSAMYLHILLGPSLRLKNEKISKQYNCTADLDGSCMNRPYPTRL